MNDQEIQQRVLTLSRREQEELLEWLENLLEDQLEITDEFKAKIQRGFGQIQDQR